MNAVVRPAFPCTLTGFFNGDLAATAATATPALTRLATSSSKPGTYRITLANVNGVVTITP